MIVLDRMISYKPRYPVMLPCVLITTFGIWHTPSMMKSVTASSNFIKSKRRLQKRQHVTHWFLFTGTFLLLSLPLFVLSPEKKKSSHILLKDSGSSIRITRNPPSEGLIFRAKHRSHSAGIQSGFEDSLAVLKQNFKSGLISSITYCKWGCETLATLVQKKKNKRPLGFPGDNSKSQSIFPHSW